MTWAEYYERYDGWQESTQYSRLASIKTSDRMEVHLRKYVTAFSMWIRAQRPAFFAEH